MTLASRTEFCDQFIYKTICKCFFNFTRKHFSGHVIEENKNDQVGISNLRNRTFLQNCCLKTCREETNFKTQSLNGGQY